MHEAEARRFLKIHGHSGRAVHAGALQRNRQPLDLLHLVFFLSHGWKGDVPAAIDQYDRWIGEMARSAADRAAARQRRRALQELERSGGARQARFAPKRE